MEAVVLVQLVDRSLPTPRPKVGHDLASGG